MSFSAEEDFPDLSIGTVITTKPYKVTHVDVDAEIQEILARKKLKAEIDAEETEAKEKESSVEDYDTNIIEPILEPTICSLPPQRKFFHEERSLKSFNEGSLTTEHVEPSCLNICTSDNAYEFFQLLSLRLRQASADVKCQYLKYLWLLLSSHSDPHVVQNCTDVLLDYNTSWRLTYDEVITVFYNWGVSPEDFVTDLPVEDITSSLNCGPVVSSYNVENALKVLINQLSRGSLTGYSTSNKTVFLLLVFLSLDKNYQQCLAEVHDCLELMAIQAASNNPEWIKIYCDALLKVELHHAQLAFLLQCVVPESMRWCLCLGHCQRVFSKPLYLQTTAKPAVLLSLLEEHFEEFLMLKSWDLYSVISIVDSGISLSVTLKTDDVIKQGFLDWLSNYSDRKPDRRNNHLDVDAKLIDELVARLQAQWELLWLAGPSSQNETVEEIEEDGC